MQVVGNQKAQPKNHDATCTNTCPLVCCTERIAGARHLNADVSGWVGPVGCGPAAAESGGFKDVFQTTQAHVESLLL